MKRIALLSFIISSIFCSTGALADEETRERYGPQFFRTGELEVDAGAAVEVFGIKEEGKDSYANLGLEDVKLRLKYNISQQIRAVLFTKFEQAIREEGMNVPFSFDIEEFIWAAYIEIREIAGQPVAVLLGKHRMAFGMEESRLPTEDDFGLTIPLSRTSQVIGVTLKLDNRVLQYLDKLEVSAFETEKGDLGIGSFDGLAIRVGKRFSRKLTGQASYRYRGFGSDDSKNEEHSFSIGFVYEDGTWSAWVHGMGFIDNNRFPSANFAIIAGIARRLGIGELALEAQYAENSFAAYRLGYKLPISRFLRFGPEVRYVDNNGNDKSEFQFGARTEVVYRKRIETRKAKNIAGQEIAK